MTEPKKTFKVYVPYQGKILDNAYESFDTRDQALAWWWAAANCAEPFEARMFEGQDGWNSNNHVRGKPFPPELKEQIEAVIAENDEISADAAAEQGRQAREWRP